MRQKPKPQRPTPASDMILSCERKRRAMIRAVYGTENANAESVVKTDLVVVVQNMLNGPAGLLRDVRFFPPAASLVFMDKQASNARTQRGEAALPLRQPRASPLGQLRRSGQRDDCDDARYPGHRREVRASRPR